MDDALDQLLRKAIGMRRMIRFQYKDLERIAEPHDYGIQNGIVRLFCYQVAGRSGARLPGWRMINVSEMRDCEMVEKQFAGNRETSTGTHHHWDQIFARVAPPS